MRSRGGPLRRTALLGLLSLFAAVTAGCNVLNAIDEAKDLAISLVYLVSLIWALIFGVIGVVGLALSVRDEARLPEPPRRLWPPLVLAIPAVGLAWYRVGWWPREGELLRREVPILVASIAPVLFLSWRLAARRRPTPPMFTAAERRDRLRSLTLHALLGGGAFTALVAAVLGSGLLPSLRGRVVQVGMSNTFGAARLSSGDVAYWSKERRVRLVPEAGEAVDLSVNDRYACVATRRGTVVCWQDSRGKEGSYPEPYPVRGVTDAVQVAVGEEQACARTLRGTVSCWHLHARSSGDLAEASVGDVVQIAAGDDHACALRSDGTAACWGSREHGQLGDGRTSSWLSSGQAVVVQGLSNAASIVAGHAFTCARLRDGTVTCWGRNQLGQLGNGTDVESSTPSPVPGLSGVEQIAAGAMHVCARHRDGTVQCWGENGMGELGVGVPPRRSPSPLPVALPDPAIGLEAGGTKTCALLASGWPLCWGGNTPHVMRTSQRVDCTGRSEPGVLMCTPTPSRMNLDE